MRDSTSVSQACGSTSFIFAVTMSELRSAPSHRNDTWGSSGPILPNLSYRTLDEALGRIAETLHPLAAFLFSREQKTIDRFIGELSIGGGAVNQVNIHLFIETMPFGGVGPAGMSHYYGKHGFDLLTRAKSMLVSPADVAIDHLFRFRPIHP
jgi:hypothetical protein